MKQFWLQVVLLIIVIFGGLYVTRNQASLNTFLGAVGMTTNSGTTVDSRKLQILDISDPTTPKLKAELNVEIADTDETRSKGLGGRSSLDPNSGMLFVWETRSIPNFWMKGMKIPLDFIWINDDKVVDLLPNIRPPEEGQSDDTLPRYAPVTEINRILEVNAGYISAHNIKVGDKVQFAESPVIDEFSF